MERAIVKVTKLLAELLLLLLLLLLIEALLRLHIIDTNAISRLIWKFYLIFFYFRIEIKLVVTVVEAVDALLLNDVFHE